MMRTTTVRPELPPMPVRIARLPVDHRGYPVPFFAAWMKDGEPVDRHTAGAVADHRMTWPGASIAACRRHVCWICGERLGVWLAYVIGPMCTINRVTAEPAMHRDCAEWSLHGCPFLTRPHAHRRDGGIPEDASMPGIGIMRNPGVMALWITRSFRVDVVNGGILFRLGRPQTVQWFTEGREASRGEVQESIESGIGSLYAIAEQEGEHAVKQLESQRQLAEALLPARDLPEDEDPDGRGDYE